MSFWFDPENLVKAVPTTPLHALYRLLFPSFKEPF